MQPLFSLEHLGLAARNADELADWYVKVLNASLVARLASNPSAFMLRFPGGALLEIYSAAEPFPERTEVQNNRRAGLRHLALRVPSIETAQAELETRGVRFTEPIKPAGGGGRVLFFTDPESNLLHLVQRPQDSTIG